MNLDVEYAIKKDIRNNPVVREVDRQHKRQLLRTIGFAFAIVAMLVFWAWQRFGMVESGYEASVLQAKLQFETAKNRRLHLEVAMLLTPQLIETQATRDLHMVAPTPATTVVIDPPAGTPRPTGIR
jgi:hypothetical protein